MMKTGYFLVVAFTAALFASALHNPEASDHLRLHLSGSLKAKEKQAVEEAVVQYNKLASSFYNTAGYMVGLEDIPATQLLKRRIFKDINMLKGDGLVLVFDRDSLQVKKIDFSSRNVALAETEEVWAVAFQALDTRKPVFDVKATEMTVRYLLHREQFLDKGKRWIVYEVDVYPKGEPVPERNVKPALRTWLAF